MNWNKLINVAKDVLENGLLDQPDEVTSAHATAKAVPSSPVPAATGDLRTDALNYHQYPVPGKLSIELSKPAETARDLTLAYSPGVAEPVKAIAETPSDAYKYTMKGNLVAVISNGTAILGLGNLGALASKPVMEGKALLFKRFAGVDAIDIEVDCTDTEELIRTIANIAPSFGGINLEDIASPQCFEVENRLKAMLDIPVFHDDQHGTAIVIAAGLTNALIVANKRLEDAKIVLVGAGAAGTASLNLLLDLGANKANILVVDKVGVLHTGMTDLPPHMAQFAADTQARTLADALVGADVFIGLSAPNLLAPEMLLSMAAMPVVFAMANPDPEIRPEVAKQVRNDVIIATGRSDYPNQVNNVLCFPYLFRGALDARSKEINTAMKLAAVDAIASLTHEVVPSDVLTANNLTSLSFGAEYILPKANDQRLRERVSQAVYQAAVDSGVARC
ncbi:MAG: malate dehydrogenase [Thiotrichales bacterium]|jgi:malate dehydrogenase (oxaloacetate-decarboxylating)(NADP+)|nr:malate dehydrogenase [Thiotrichales bacterium]